MGIIQDERRVTLRDGRLCFSFLEKSDAGEYQCSVASSFDNEGALPVNYRPNPIGTVLRVTGKDIIRWERSGYF